MRFDAFQPVLLITFLTPLLCVVEFTVVLLKPVPWQEEQERLLCLECFPVLGGLPWQLVQDVGVGVGVGVGVEVVGLSMNEAMLVLSVAVRVIP